ncbi:MAG: DUF3108 domain-containing protein [bacterium]|nr:DUF3108 domain-containing protein [bacterium]
MLKILFISLVIILCFKNSFAQERILSKGEELTYEVSYGFIKLGEVKMVVTDLKEEKGKKIYTAKSFMRSYDGVPLVSLNSVFESDIVFDSKELYTRRFKAIEYKDEGVITIEYKFNYDSQFVHVKKDNMGRVEIDSNIRINKNIKFQDGLSLFYLARLNSFTTENFLVPVFMNEMETSVNYFFSSKPDEISVDAFKNDVNAVRCSGTANFTGVFGLTGEFIGWFSDDERRMPLKSQLNVIVGNVTLELTSFK